MVRTIPVLVALAVALSATSHAALAQPKPVFKLGFKALADQIPDVVGEPLEEEQWAPNGDSVQRTTTGLMVWRKADHWTAFTNGSRTWSNGPFGIQERGNLERFDWESVAATPARAEQAQPAPTPAPTPGEPAQPASLTAHIDSPKDGDRITGNLKIVGWAFSSTEAGTPWNGVDAFRVFMDGPEGTGKLLNTRVTRGQRPDVAAASGIPPTLVPASALSATATRCLWDGIPSSCTSTRPTWDGGPSR